MQTTYRSTGLPQRPINMQREEGRDSAMLYFSKSQRSCRRGLMERYQAEWECRGKIHEGRRKLRSTAQWSLLTQKEMLQRPSLVWELWGIQLSPHATLKGPESSRQLCPHRILITTREKQLLTSTRRTRQHGYCSNYYLLPISFLRLLHLTQGSLCMDDTDSEYWVHLVRS